jgi:hypothetical protein
MILSIIVLLLASIGVFLVNQHYKKKDQTVATQTIPDNIQEKINKAVSEEKLEEAPVKKKKKYYYSKKK